ncbi:MAG: response regulator transcription factor [Planctomycetes bacterium]|nr:response regulator transcription factor [Planctomycetota bacterium]
MRILVADDHGIVREGLKSLIEKQGDMEIVGEAEDGRTTVQLARELSPDIVIMDVNMPPGISGIEATRLILAEKREIRVVVLSMHKSEHIVLEALRAGVLGYVLKSNLSDELLKALEVAANNEHYLSPQIMDIALRGLSRESLELTSRERQIVKMTAEGYTIKQIALELHRSPKRVDTIRHQVMEKLGVQSIAGLTIYAIIHGIITLEF